MKSGPLNRARSGPCGGTGKPILSTHRRGGHHERRIELDATLDEQAVVAAAARRSMRVYGAREYRANPRVGPPALIVGYGGICEAGIPEAVRQLAFAIEAARRNRR